MSNQRAFDDLAGIYMTGAEERGTVGLGASVSMVPGPIQVVLGGNLPSMAGIWFAQLVDRWSRTNGPCGLIRFDDQKVRLDVFRFAGRLSAATGEQLLEEACRAVRSWAIVLPPGFSGQDLGVGSRPPIFMTGCDEAAIAAAKLRIDELRLLCSSEAQTMHELQLVTVGATDSDGRRVADDITDWAITSTGIAVRWCGSIERVDRLESVQSVEIPGYGRQDVGRFAARLSALLRNSARGDSVPPAAALPGVASAVTHEQPAVTPSSHSANPPVRSPSESMLAYFPELVGIRVRASTAPEVELAVDVAGRLHLISRDPTTRDLRLARSWCSGNWALLSSAVVDLRQIRQPVLVDHLVFDDARHAVSLHGAGLLLHVLIDSAGQRRRIDLNDEQSAGLGG
jgi:hypothetical protein